MHAAAVAFNSKKSISRLYKSLNGGKSPTGKLRRFEDKRAKKNAYNKIHKKPRRRLFKASEKNKDYGEGCIKPDMDDEIFRKVKSTFLNYLNKTVAEKEKNTEKYNSAK